MAKTKILCLHGAHTSGEIFQAQLGQLATRIAQEQNLELHFLDGLIETEGQEDIKAMFSEPYYSWVSMSSDKKMVDTESAKQALDYVQDVMVEDGPFDGIIGFSEGAAIGLALLLRHAAENPLEPPYAICKWAVFFSRVGIDRELNNLEEDSPLGIPSLHVLDQSDILLGAGGANVATEPGLARFIFHSRGHDIPRDNATANVIMVAVQDLQHRAIVV